MLSSCICAKKILTFQFFNYIYGNNRSLNLYE